MRYSPLKHTFVHFYKIKFNRSQKENLNATIIPMKDQKDLFLKQNLFKLIREWVTYIQSSL